MDILKKEKLIFKQSKVQFITQELVFLGHVVSKDSIKPESNKIKAVSKIPAPQDRGNYVPYLGMIACVSQFITNHGKLTAPLYALTRDKRPFLGTPERDQCFKELKRLLYTVPVLQFPQRNRPYQMETYASDRAISVSPPRPEQ